MTEKKFLVIIAKLLLFCFGGVLSVCFVFVLQCWELNPGLVHARQVLILKKECINPFV
jgi:hypothetical protein